MQFKNIQVDIEVWKEIVNRMISFDDTPNDILRRLLDLGVTDTRTKVTLGNSRQNGPKRVSQRKFGYTLLGEEKYSNNARDVLISALKDISEKYPDFMEKFVSLPKHGRKRRFIARSREELYPGRIDLARDFSFNISNGYWVGTNYSRSQIRQILQLACEVAGLNWGEEFSVKLGD